MHLDQLPVLIEFEQVRQTGLVERFAPALRQLLLRQRGIHKG
jgi:hypothetical protein